MELELILDLEIQKNPEKYSTDSIDRVYKFIEKVEANPERYAPYKLFKELTDFQLYYQIHPEWHGKNTSQMHKNKELKGDSFYAAFRQWTIKKANGDETYQKELLKIIFPRAKLEWKKYKNIDDWKRYYDSILEWKDKSPNDIRKDYINHGNKLYCSLFKWTEKKAKGDTNYREELLKKVFGKGYIFHTPKKEK